MARETREEREAREALEIEAIFEERRPDLYAMMRDLIAEVARGQ